MGVGFGDPTPREVLGVGFGDPTPREKRVKIMSKIDDLIKQHCPNGVEWKELWEITYWDKRFNGVDKEKQKNVINFKHTSAEILKQIELTNNGNIRLLSTGNYNGYTTIEHIKYKELVNQGEVISIPSGGGVSIKYYNGLFVDSGNILGVSVNPQKINLKYIFYYLLNIKEKIELLYRGAGIKHPAMSEILQLKIPLPPLPVQEEIVRILDKFTELEKELEKRKQQYDYYRNELLNPENMRGAVEWKTLGEICNIKGRIGFRGYTKNDLVPKHTGAISLSPANIINSSIVFDSNTYISWDKYNESPEIIVKEHDVIFCKTGSIGKVALIKYLPEPATINPQLVVLKNIKCNNFYLAYILGCIHFQNVIQKIKGIGSIPTISQKDLGNQKIPIPPLQEQEKIVKILDKFDALVNDISIGLPAEIKARRKQYEYYRDKLLNFDECGG